MTLTDRCVVGTLMIQLRKIDSFQSVVTKISLLNVQSFTKYPRTQCLYFLVYVTFNKPSQVWLVNVQEYIA